MALPQLNTAKYELTLPSNGDLVEYRPYLVKEEKILMLAMESNDNKQIVNATRDIVDACTFGKVDINKLPMFDLEYIFLKLRSKSIGEKAQLKFKCSNCEKPNEYEMNLDNVEPTKPDLVDKVQITDDIGVILKFPTVEQMAGIGGDNEVDQVFQVLARSIDSIYDAERVYPANESTEEELLTFIENLNQGQFNKLQDYFQSMPKLEHTVKFDCHSCGTANEYKLEGLQSFFA